MSNTRIHLQALVEAIAFVVLVAIAVLVGYLLMKYHL